MTTPATRLEEAEKQIRLSKDELDDDSLSDDLQEAILLVVGVRDEISDAAEDP